jgi:hypothetical protein
VVGRGVTPEGARLNDPPSKLQDGALSRLPLSAGLTLYARRRSNMRKLYEIGGALRAAALNPTPEAPVGTLATAAIAIA